MGAATLLGVSCRLKLVPGSAVAQRWVHDAFSEVCHAVGLWGKAGHCTGMPAKALGALPIRLSDSDLLSAFWMGFQTVTAFLEQVQVRGISEVWSSKFVFLPL